MSLKKILALMALGVAGGSIYIIPYIKYVFYDQQIQAMGITNTQSGMLVSVYAIVAILLLLPGGVFADRFSAKKLICLSLFGTSALSVLYAFTLSYHVALAIWVGFGITCAFVFWPALIKAIGAVGKAEEQGRMYGTYYAINGIAAALINVAALYVCSSFEDGARGFFWAVMLVAGGTFLALLMMLFLFDDNNLEIKTAPEDRFKFSDIGRVVKLPDTWLLTFGIFVSYSIYSSNTYFNPFLIDVVGVTPTDSGAFTILRTYVFMLLAPLGGFLCDRVFRSTAKWYAISFGLMALMLMGAMLLPPTINPTLAGIYTLLPAAVTMAQYGVAWSIQRELNIPVAVMGTAIGISSFVNWSPDMFMHTMFGYWLDSHGNAGYTYIFGYLIALALLGMVLGLVICKRARQRNS